MKHILSSFIVLITTINTAQIPQGYYDTATGTSYTLKSQLNTIITHGHTARSYSDLFDIYRITDTDKYYENDNSILDIYSENPNGTDPYFYSNNKKCGSYTKEGDCYNREHLMPQSLYSEKLPMKTDAHFVIPVDGYVNSRRSRFPFGYVTNASFISKNGSKIGTGNNKGYTGTVFEPIDEFKGDIARAMLYFAVRYENNWDDSGWLDYNATENPMNGTSDQFYDDWFLETMLEWHYNDPVSPREITRNTTVYNFQGNRNPFIDYPNYVTAIWGNRDTKAPTTPTNLKAFNATLTSITISWGASTDNVGVIGYDIFIDGTYLKTVTQTNAIITKLIPNTQYCFTVTAKDAANNSSNFSNQSCLQTLKEHPNGTTVTDLFISEYIEGSSYNKAIEIANFTGIPLKLSNYTLKLARNGNDFSTTYTFPVNANVIDNETVFVITHDKMITSCKAKENDSNSIITNFNGNDVIGLFKNNTLIDIIGTVGQTSDFAKDITLIRKTNITIPNSTYTLSDWAVKSKDDCSNLGFHDQTLSLKNITGTNHHVVLRGDTLHIAYKKRAIVTVYTSLGHQVLKHYLKNTNTINLRVLNKGVYIVKSKIDGVTNIKKIVKQ